MGNKQHSSVGLMIRGAAMGMAEVIPGVSGGTIAFITGIYERLISSIKSIGLPLIGVAKKDGIAGLWKAVDGNFLLFLIGGMIGGIVVGVFGISYLLENYPPIVWAFFFGLILGSVFFIGRQITGWSWKEIVALVVCTVAAYFLTTSLPAAGSTSYVYVFLSGMIGISALILPGISGSFILLIMGMYTYIVQDTLKGVLSTFATDKIITMIVFGLGCLTGLMSISRILSWTFANYKNVTLAALTGFMLGSLNKIWPWRQATEWLRDSGGNIIMDEETGLPDKILMEDNISPLAYEFATGLNAYLYLAILFFILGLVIVFLMAKADDQKD
jgi:putative membrane protein